MSNLGSLVVSLEANIAKFTSDMGKAAAIAEQRMAQIDKAVGLVKNAMATLGASSLVGLTVDKVKASIEGAIASAAGLQQLSERTGATVEGFSALASVAKLSGTDTETLATSLQKLSKSMNDAEHGGQKSVEAFRAIGISVSDIRDKKPDEMFLLISNRLAEYADGSGKTALAQQLLGKAGANLLPVMKDLADVGILQTKVTAEQAAMADDYEKNLIRIQAANGAVYKVIAFQVLPVLDAFSLAMLDAIKGTNGLKSSVDALAADNSIRNWAKTAALEVASVIDMFEGFSRMVEITGKWLGNLGTLIALNATGKWTEARAAGKAFEDDVQAILSRPMFSKRLNDRLEAPDSASLAGPPKAPKPAINFDPTKGGGGEDPSKLILEGALKKQEAFIASEKALLSAREQYLQSYYSQEYLDANTFYSTKQQLIQDALAAELAAYAKESAAVAIYKATSADKNAAQIAINKQAEIATKVTEAQTRASKQLTDVALEQARVYREFDLATQSVARHEQLANDQARFAIDMMGRSTLEVAQLTEARRLQLALEERLYQMRLKNLPQEQLEKAVLDFEAQKKAAIDLVTQAFEKQRTATFGAAEAVRKYLEEANNTGAQIETAFTNAFKGMEDALVTFITTGKLSFTNLANSIVADITRIIVKQQIMAPLMAAMGLGGSAAPAKGNNPSAYVAPTASIFGSIAGLFGFANGGEPPVGIPSLVGENGPELFVPKSAGTIIPNSALQAFGEGRNVHLTVNQNFPAGATRQTTLQAAADAARELRYAGRNL